jgi:hypothetical protein
MISENPKKHCKNKLLRVVVSENDDKGIKKLSKKLGIPISLIINTCVDRVLSKNSIEGNV